MDSFSICAAKASTEVVARTGTPAWSDERSSGGSGQRWRSGSGSDESNHRHPEGPKERKEEKKR